MRTVWGGCLVAARRARSEADTAYGSIYQGLRTWQLNPRI
jgi:hypothetical protein